VSVEAGDFTYSMLSFFKISAGIKIFFLHDIYMHLSPYQPATRWQKIQASVVMLFSGGRRGRGNFSFAKIPSTVIVVE